jgi:Cys-Gly metallodipeptidase DUG1
LVPNQTPEKVHKIVETYLKGKFAALSSKNMLEPLKSLGTGKPWVADVKHWNFDAGKAATRVNNESLDALRILPSIPFFHRRYTTKNQI